MPAKKPTSTKKLTIDESPNRISMFYRHAKAREAVVEKGERTWVCPTCRNKIKTYTALTALPVCTGADRKHSSRQMEEKK